MKIMIDTNVIIDIFSKREKYYEKSLVTFLSILEGYDMPMIPTSTVTDIYFILKGYIGKKKALESISELCNSISLVDTKERDITDALTSKGPDFEDNVLASVAKRNSADYIITRNTKDFKYSKVKALTPEEFLKKQNKDNWRVHEDTLDVYRA